MKLIEYIINILFPEQKSEFKSLNDSGFEKTREIINSIPCINFGGCGISALSMYRWIKKYQQIDDMSFTFLYSDNDGFSHNEQILSGKNHSSVLFAPTHVILRIEGFFIDSNEVFETVNDLCYKRIHKQITENQLVESINQKHYWNNDFNRTYITKIQNSLKIDLSDIIK